MFERKAQSERYILTDTQGCWDYWEENLVPFVIDEDDITELELDMWFDAWLDWVIGYRCIGGNDIAYQYAYTTEAEARLQQFGIPHEVFEEEPTLGQYH